jgi:hypothetical protein
MAAWLFRLGCERRGEEKGGNGDATAAFFTSSWPGHDMGEVGMARGIHVAAMTRASQALKLLLALNQSS